MLKDSKVFASFSVDDLSKAKEFYSETLGLDVEEREHMGIELQLNGMRVHVYEKPNHQAASFTVLNFIVNDIDKTVDELVEKGIKFEKYDIPGIEQDEKGISRGLEANMGPNIAWFKDLAGNTIAILQTE